MRPSLPGFCNCDVFQDSIRVVAAGIYMVGDACIDLEDALVLDKETKLFQRIGVDLHGKPVTLLTEIAVGF